MAGDPTLLFGIGATKAGTSWLHDYLAGHPECRLSLLKELHYFDSIDAGRREKRAIEVDAMIESFAGRAGRGDNRDYRRAMLADLRAWAPVARAGDEAAYLDFLRAGAGDTARVVGDVTPSYGMLSAERLARMAQMAPAVRFVYLLRDPVDRLWSHVRMIARRRNADASPQELAAAAGRILRRALRGKEDHIIARGDYAGALARLWQATEPRQRLVLFFEELFRQPTIDRLCAFLGLTAHPADFDRQVHAGVAAGLNGNLRAEATAFLTPQYDAVNTYMGRVPGAWTGLRTGV